MILPYIFIMKARNMKILKEKKIHLLIFWKSN
jgi:hypothetical protein